MKPIRWGILSTGKIAASLAETLKKHKGAELLAVGSRQKKSAEQFGRQFDIPRRYANYQDLVNDPDVDVVYVATPHNLHHQNTLIALEAGKHVLCEKSFALNAAQSREMIAAARRKKLFLMEAMWMRFIPATIKLLELLKKGTIGEVRALRAEFGIDPGVGPEHRLLNLNLAGGSLLDVGVYPVALAHLVFGRPQSVATRAHIGPTGVDEQAGMVFGYPGGRIASLLTAVTTAMTQTAFIYGTKGYIQIHPFFWHSKRLTVYRKNRPPQAVPAPYSGTGYQFEVEEVMRSIRAGKLQSDLWPLSETLAVMETMDTIRAQWGLRYPSETGAA